VTHLTPPRRDGSRSAVRARSSLTRAAGQWPVMPQQAPQRPGAPPRPTTMQQRAAARRAPSRQGAATAHRGGAAGRGLGFRVGLRQAGRHARVQQHQEAQEGERDHGRERVARVQQRAAAPPPARRPALAAAALAGLAAVPHIPAVRQGLWRVSLRRVSPRQSAPGGRNRAPGTARAAEPARARVHAEPGLGQAGRCPKRC